MCSEEETACCLLEAKEMTEACKFGGQSGTS